MTALTPAMDGALSADRCIPVLMIEADLPGGPMRLFFGSGAIPWPDPAAPTDPTKVRWFRDTDDTYGQLAAVDEISDGDDDEAPPFTFTMLPWSDAAAAAICSPANQGSEVFVWLGALSPTTYQLLPDPTLLGFYEWDIATLSPDHNAREVEIECVSAFDILLEDDEGSRLSDAFLQSITPGDTGCSNVTGLEELRYWGMATPRTTGTVVTGSGGGGISGTAALNSRVQLQ